MEMGEILAIVFCVINRWNALVAGLRAVQSSHAGVAPEPCADGAGSRSDRRIGRGLGLATE